MFSIDGTTAVFSTNTMRAKHWFFPRYADGRLHEEPVTRLLLSKLASADTFLDIGACLGYFTCLAAKHKPSVRVLAFEMDSENCRILEENVKLNDCHNVEVYHAAVASSRGLVHYDSSPNPHSAVFSLSRGAEAENRCMQHEVPAIVLDEVLASTSLGSCIVKIDVEGAEMGVLDGMQEIFRKYAPSLFLEVHPKELQKYDRSINDVFELLRARGYEVLQIENHRLDDPVPQLQPIDDSLSIKGNTMLLAEPT